jgi:hypothetical protein
LKNLGNSKFYNIPIFAVCISKLNKSRFQKKDAIELVKKKDAVERLTWSHFSHIEREDFVNACEKRS